MPGPISGDYTPWLHVVKDSGYKVVEQHGRPSYVTRHGKCREGAACTGPGCRVRTGKTNDARNNRWTRKLVA